MFATNLLFQERTELAQRLNQLLGRPVQVEMPRVSDWISRFTASRMQLSEQQRQEMAANNRVLILTGGPGTGKTFSVRTIIALWKAMVNLLS